MRVSRPDEDNWLKLRRLIQYLSGTTEMKRIIEARTLKILATWVDSSSAVHADMKSHMGGYVGFKDGVGVVHSKSTKQQINEKA